MSLSERFFSRPKKQTYVVCAECTHQDPIDPVDCLAFKDFITGRGTRCYEHNRRGTCRKFQKANPTAENPPASCSPED